MDLLPLTDLPPQALAALCAAAVAYISASFSSAAASASVKEIVSAQSLQVSASSLTSSVLAIAKLFSESAKRNHDEQLFRRSLSPYALPGTVRDTMAKCYLENRVSIFETVPAKSSSTRQ
jgi:hypothetical protein